MTFSTTLLSVVLSATLSSTPATLVSPFASVLLQAPVANNTKSSSAPKAADDEDEDEAKKPAATATTESDEDRLYGKFELQRGLYVTSDLGLFMVFGGANKAVSNLQPYIGLSLGYDINQWFSWQIHAGRGFAASSPRSAAQDQQNRIRDFSFTNVLTGPVVWLMVMERLAIELKAHGGVSILDPIPLEAAIDGVQVPGVVAVVGGGVALKYLTLLTDFTLGLDITFNYLLAANIPSLAITPSVRYTF